MDEDTIITGCEDGLVRGIGVHPNKVLSVVFKTSESADKALPIQKVAISGDKTLGGAIYENNVGFYNLKYVKERDKLIKGKTEKAPDAFYDNLQS